MLGGGFDMTRASFARIERLLGIAIVAISAAILFAVFTVWIFVWMSVLLVLPFFVASLLLTCEVAVAQPRTMYKPQDIDNARQNLERYGWAQKIVSGWENEVEFAMQQAREFFEESIPELTPGTHYGQNCPHCVGRQSLMGSGSFNWSISAPEQLTCNDCGTGYPNEEYPETGVLECPRMGQTFTYYQTPEERANPEQPAEYVLKWLGARPTMTSFSGLIRYRKVSWAWRQALTLAKLYAVTGDIAYAERVVWILDSFARVFKNYLYHSYDGSVADWPPAEVAANMGEQEAIGGPRGGRFPREVIRHAYGLNQYDDYSTLHNGFWGAGRLNVHGKGSDAGPLIDMTVAYDVIRDAQYPDGRRLLDDDMEHRILNDLIVAGCTDMEHWDSLSNKGTAVLVLSAAIGMLLEQPQRVRHALDGFNRMLGVRYHFDGFYSESPAYAAHNFSNVRELPDLLYDYSDQPDYQPEEGPRLENLNPFTTGRFHLALQSLMRMLAPGNRLPVIGDTRENTGANILSAEVLAARLGGHYAGLLQTIQGASLSERGSEYALWYRPPDLDAEGAVELPLRSEWFPGWHVGVLRGGREANDTALYFNGNEHHWTLQTGHRQRDILSLSYYAYGEELASDRGYFSGSGQLLPDGRSGQRWTSSTLSHNLVVVDEEDQASRECGSNLELFGVKDGIEVIQASGFNVYPQCEDYRRTCALVQTSEEQPYVVDFFRVKGGQNHQYSFHCNGSLVELRPGQPAPQPVALNPAWSMWLNNARAVTPEVPYTFTWQFRDVSLDLIMLNTQDTLDRIIIADAPGWRVGTSSELEKPPIQQILAENRANNPDAALATQYAAVIVPYKTSASPVVAARLLENDLDSGALAVEVKLAGRTDYIISTLDQQPRRYGPVTVAGQFAFVSVDSQEHAVFGYLLNGVSLECGELQIALPEPNTTLKVQSVADRTFHLAEPLSAPPATRGSYLLAGQAPRTGFEIESAAGDAITVRDYPALACDEVTLLNSGCSRVAT